jgi:cobalt-precorrin-5B (C1)-methyltransferase
VFACAAAIAALRWLRQPGAIASVPVNLVEPDGIAEIAIEQVAGLHPGTALAITRSDPGDNLDLTRHTPIWVLVELWAEEKVEGRRQKAEGGKDAEISSLIPHPPSPSTPPHPPILIEAGEGIGRLTDGQPAIYAYARRLLLENLEPLLQPGERLRLTVVLPEGRNLARRTSNQAFGVVEGLSLLGTTGISQPLSAPGQLEAFRQELQQKVRQFDGVAEKQDDLKRSFNHPAPVSSPELAIPQSGCLVFCVGENGLDLAQKLGINRDRLLKTANWLGPLLVEAAIQGVPSILLFGYHGKLIKLAGGIFHTHHHLADGRMEILTAHCARIGLPTTRLQTIFACQTVEDGLQYLQGLDAAGDSDWVEQVYRSISQTIDQRSQDYIRTHSDRTVLVGSVLFDRQRRILIKSEIGFTLLEQVC